jgi:uncharacterized repeat protein (TIGR01451 family)
LRYDTLADLPAGVEEHGVEAAFSDLLSAALPSAWDVSAEPGSRDLRLAAGAPEIDAGAALPNLNDAFTLSGLPDLGAFEYGQPLPFYGVRPAAPDLSASSKQASVPLAALGEVVTYTITVFNAGLPLAGSAVVTDTVPLGLAYASGSLWASSGAVDDSAAPLLRWSGDLAGGMATIRYAATVTETGSRAIANTAWIAAAGVEAFSRQAVVLVNGYGVYLPMVGRE